MSHMRRKPAETTHSLTGKQRAPLLPALVLPFLFLTHPAAADPTGTCAAADGAYLTGTVVSAPTFKRGYPRHGVELSHTHLTLKADQDQQTYDVAIDNVFASGYDAAGEAIPAPLSTIKIGDRLELCGKLYPEGGGIDWVHTDCGDAPTPADPNGSLKEIAPNGTTGPNLEGSTEYCRLWPQHYPAHTRRRP